MSRQSQINHIATKIKEALSNNSKSVIELAYLSEIGYSTIANWTSEALRLCETKGTRKIVKIRDTQRAEDFSSLREFSKTSGFFSSTYQIYCYSENLPSKKNSKSKKEEKENNKPKSSSLKSKEKEEAAEINALVKKIAAAINERMEKKSQKPLYIQVNFDNFPWSSLTVSNRISKALSIVFPDHYYLHKPSLRHELHENFEPWPEYFDSLQKLPKSYEMFFSQDLLGVLMPYFSNPSEQSDKNKKRKHTDSEAESDSAPDSKLEPPKKKTSDQIQQEYQEAWAPEFFPPKLSVGQKLEKLINKYFHYFPILTQGEIQKTLLNNHPHKIPEFKNFQWTRDDDKTTIITHTQQALAQPKDFSPTLTHFLAELNRFYLLCKSLLNFIADGGEDDDEDGDTDNDAALVLFNECNNSPEDEENISYEKAQDYVMMLDSVKIVSGELISSLTNLQEKALKEKAAVQLNTSQLKK